MAIDGEENLGEFLRTAGEETLSALTGERLGEIDPRTARQALRNPFVTGVLIEILLDAPALAAAYDLRRDAAFHPRTPRLLALRLVGGLFWATAQMRSA